MNTFTPVPNGYFHPSRVEEQQASLARSPTKIAELLILTAIASGILGLVRSVVDAAAAKP